MTRLPLANAGQLIEPMLATAPTAAHPLEVKAAAGDARPRQDLLEHAGSDCLAEPKPSGQIGTDRWWMLASSAEWLARRRCKALRRVQLQLGTD